MKSASSRTPKRELEARITLFEAAAGGELDGLACPKCGESNVSVWFTHPAKREYRTWFGCSSCDFRMRSQNSSKPAAYSKKRDRTPRRRVAKLGA